VHFDTEGGHKSSVKVMILTKPVMHAVDNP
jgi:hypothetical protein